MRFRVTQPRSWGSPWGLEALKVLLLVTLVTVGLLDVTLRWQGHPLPPVEAAVLRRRVHAELVLSELGSGQNATGAAAAGRQAGDSQTAQGVQQQLNKLQEALRRTELANIKLKKKVDKHLLEEPADQAAVAPADCGGYAMVIVEPRAHPDLQYVLENFDKNMPLYYDLYIFHGKSYGEYARAAAYNVVPHRRTRFFSLGSDDSLWRLVPKAQRRWPGSNGYNNLLKDEKRFWGKIDAENILMFQTDSVVCGGSPRKISDFEHLAYIGCAYDETAGANSTAQRWFGPSPFWGNGGVVFRKKSAALACIRAWPEFAASSEEDRFFGTCVDSGYGRRPEPGQLAQFCQNFESGLTAFTAHSLFAHHLQVPLGKDTGVHLFLQYCPEALPLVRAAAERRAAEWRAAVAAEAAAAAAAPSPAPAPAPAAPSPKAKKKAKQRGL